MHILKIDATMFTLCYIPFLSGLQSPYAASSVQFHSPNNLNSNILSIQLDTSSLRHPKFCWFFQCNFNYFSDKFYLTIFLRY